MHRIIKLRYRGQLERLDAALELVIDDSPSLELAPRTECAAHRSFFNPHLSSGLLYPYDDPSP